MNIAIAHFRTGLTDGVSLEIDKRKAVLESMGHPVSLIAGTHSGHIDLYIPYFEYKKNPKLYEINRLAFLPDKATELQNLLDQEAQEVENSLEEFHAKTPFEVLFIHNIFCLAVSLPSSLGFYNFLKKHPEIKGITIHHDFYWEEARAHLFAFANPYAREVLEKTMPPNLPNLKHTVINTIAQAALKEKRGIDSIVLSDTFDFSIPVSQKDETNKDFLKDCGLKPSDLIFLTAVRVRERKAIELAIDVVRACAAQKSALVGQCKYSGEEITEDSQVVLLIPGEYTEKEAFYVQKLKDMADRYGVQIRWLQNVIGSEEQKAQRSKKYSLWDCYVYADIVMYTSIWEGWGNQFMEAIIARKPVVIFEYPVFTSDIQPFGLDVISLGQTFEYNQEGLVTVAQEKIDMAAQKVLEVIKDIKKYEQSVHANYRIGKENFNIQIQLKNHLEKIIS
jgi:hypothetical protein